MYPHVTQFETRRRDLERELQLIRERGQARAGIERRKSEMRRPELGVANVPDTRRDGPPRHKLALLTWVGAYGVITLILELLGPFVAPWPLPLRTLLLSALMVPALTWAVMPTLTRLFRGWLLATTRDSAPRGT